ncbi:MULTISPECIES: chitobiase/beta-hexosaminidase C-terminal domain-containing protein [unclassified Paenibacillus]|uniref:non-contractile tail sheath protein n=1 Tax=unclassified Paenibacillus TaxID=185978 RepID=UPI0015A3E7B4|nr:MULTISPECIES: chitobiase/beta-hexosaminidase C-terminal domain-containing protein [unclassified Paenibacillus]
MTEDEHHFATMGNFRTSKDFDVMYWETEDIHSHPDLKYPSNPDYTNVLLEYEYEISGDAVPMDGTPAPTLTVVTMDNQAYYIRLWNYVIDRPQEVWEQGISQELGISYSFPANRTAGTGSGSAGKIRIDFNNLYAGWEPFIQEEIAENEFAWIPNPEWVKIPVNQIKRLEWAFVPQEYDYNEEEIFYFSESKPFKIKFNNWHVYGQSFLMDEKPIPPVGKVRISDGYDDSYNLTPERLVSDYSRLGFGGIVDFYVGASHYYDKHHNGQNGMELIQEHPFNTAFSSWYSSYVKLLAQRNIKVVASISMENVDAPPSWWQRAWDGQAAETLWSPTPKLLSFTNAEVRSYYQKYVLGLAEIHADHQQVPIIQLGEPWWWYMDSLPGSPPTFYDQTTKDLYQQQFGQPMHEFHSAYDSISGHETMLNWLSAQNGNFSLMLRDTLKGGYPNGQFTVLLFIPTVVDPELAPPMMGIVNFPITQWQYPNLDFFMIEDYDYLIANNMEKHRQALTVAQRKLHYPANQIHYLAGADSTNNDSIWKNIDQAISDGINMNFAEIYLWAYPQVKQRAWTQPSLIRTNVAPGLLEEETEVSLSAEHADSILYTVDGREPSMHAGQLYSGTPIPIAKDTRIRAAIVKDGSVGKPVSFDYLLNRAQYKYDASNRLQWQTFFQDEQKYRFAYTYDANGNQSKRTVNKIYNLWGDQNIIPVMSQNISPDGTASASSYFGDNYAPYKAFDHLDLEHAWITNGVAEGWLAFQFPTPKQVVSYKILPRNEITAIQASPKAWTFEGFNGIRWNVLATETNVTDWSLREFKSFNVQNVGSYSDYRINIQQNNGHWYTSIGEIEMTEGDDAGTIEYNIIPAMTGNESAYGTASSSSEFGESYAAYKAFDHVDSEQSWITNGTVEGWLAYHFPLPKLVRSYKITPRYDSSTLASAPKTWTLEGFNGTNWRVLSTETDITDWQVSMPKTFQVQNPGIFSKYRLHITNNNGHWWTSVGELEMMQ